MGLSLLITGAVASVCGSSGLGLSKAATSDSEGNSFEFRGSVKNLLISSPSLKPSPSESATWGSVSKPSISSWSPIPSPSESGPFTGGGS